MTWRSIPIRCTGLLLAACGLVAIADIASAQLTISRYTIDGGGGTRSTGGTFGLGGTIGQPDAGLLTGATFTLSGGFWSGGDAVTGVGDDVPGDGIGLPNGAPPLAFQVHRASPNPVDERMALAFDLPEAAPVHAALYDAAGRLVRVLAEGMFNAGHHESTWDRRDQLGARVPSGIYFVRLNAGTNRDRQKIVVLR